MKKLIALTLLLATLGMQVAAQSRKLRPDELAFYTTLYKTMYAAMPHSYKAWTVTNDDKADLDINNYWCPDRDAPTADCRGTINANVGRTESYGLVNQVEFEMPSGESSQVMVASLAGLKDFTNAAQVAKSLKTAASTKLSIQIVANMDGGDFEVSYCGKTPPVPIKLPVPATLAQKGIRSPACPIMADGQPDMHANYYDVAIIFLGMPVAGKTADDRSDGLLGMRYKIGFAKAKISKPVLQNIAVTIKGDAADIDAAIAAIDWKALYALISK